MGNALRKKDDLTEAVACYQQAIKIKPNYFEAFNNMGLAMKGKDELAAAIESYAQAIKIKPDFAEAYNNKGKSLLEATLGSDAAIDNFQQALKIKPDYADAHKNMGVALTEIGETDAAIDSFNMAIKIEPDCAESFSNLGIALYLRGDMDAAIQSQETAKRIDPNLKSSRLLSRIFSARKQGENIKTSTNFMNRSGCYMGLNSELVVVSRPVEDQLVGYLYEKKLVDLSREDDPSFGNAKGSNYDLFQDDHSIIKTVVADLESILMDVVKSEVFLFEGFFSIFGAGGGTGRHTHLNRHDNIPGLGLAGQKHSLVYYLSVGDQDCSEPGILKLYNPVEDILPKEGMITIFPSDRPHSSVYGGKTDRVIIGVNFYSL